MIMESQNGIQGSIHVGNAVDCETAAEVSGQVHLLPCSVKFDGACSVSHYFRPKPTDVEVEGIRIDEAHFRGRKIHGTNISLPQGFSGFILGKKGVGSKRKTLEGNENCWETNAKFKDVTYWKHDSLPSQHDAFLRSFHWLAVAKAMHQPARAEDLVSASVALEKMK